MINLIFPAHNGMVQDLR